MNGVIIILMPVMQIFSNLVYMHGIHWSCGYSVIAITIQHLAFIDSIINGAYNLTISAVDKTSNTHQVIKCAPLGNREYQQKTPISCAQCIV